LRDYWLHGHECLSCPFPCLPMWLAPCAPSPPGLQVSPRYPPLAFAPLLYRYTFFNRRRQSLLYSILWFPECYTASTIAFNFIYKGYVLFGKIQNSGQKKYKWWKKSNRMCFAVIPDTLTLFRGPTTPAVLVKYFGAERVYNGKNMFLCSSCAKSMHNWCKMLYILYCGLIFFCIIIKFRIFFLCLSSRRTAKGQASFWVSTLLRNDNPTEG
jgi:hypothetical protein